MVAGSIVVRDRLDSREEDRNDPLRVVCAAELATACDRLRQAGAQVTVEPAAATADRLAAADDPDVDGWLVPAPWPEIVDGRRRGRDPLFSDVGAPIARSPLVLVVQRDLRARCGNSPGWKCLGDQAVAGMARPGHADPVADALGTLIIGQAASAFFARGDLSSLDLDDPNFARWFRALELAAPRTLSGGSALEEMLGTTFATYNAVATVEAEARPILERSALRDRVELLYPEPMATADVVLAGTGDDARRVRELTDDARRALVDSGWRADAAGLPPTNGLPSPGFLDALRTRARELR